MSERIESLLKEYPKLKMELKCLEHQISNFEGISETDMIESLYHQKAEGDRVQTSRVSEKTANIAISYRKKMERINKEWREHLEKKYAIISEEIVFFESAIHALSGELPNFISDLVFEGLTWDELTLKYHICRTSVAKYRKKAINELIILYLIHEKELAEYLLS